MTTINPYRYHVDQPRCTTLEVRVDGVFLDILVSGSSAIATCAVDGPCRVEVRRTDGTQITAATVHPINLGISVDTGNTGMAAFTLPGPQRILINLPGGPELFLFADPIAEEEPTGRRVLRFEAGKIHEVGTLSLNDGDTLWIEGGAVLRGRLRVKNATDVTVCGRGVFDGIAFLSEKRRSFYLVFDHCRQLAVRDVLVINSPLWQMVIGACENVAVCSVKEVGYAGSSDGFDIVGSRNVRIHNCFYRTADDALVVKSETIKMSSQEEPLQWACDVEDVEVSGCAIVTHGSGAAFEIGHELATEAVRNIRFLDCDVIATHGFGGTFSIRNAGRALVEDISFNNLRLDGVPVRDLDEIELFTRHCRNIRIEA